ncbi:hypothetical protein GCK32_002199 [Trichostrongylus colubriformis]|uniref:K Homology domain-containing protein n=1 Tax=Trichostrongylus colubriformis TaxID=6319 RepID=A0AAN8INN3_TRICO
MDNAGVEIGQSNSLKNIKRAGTSNHPEKKRFHFDNEGADVQAQLLIPSDIVGVIIGKSGREIRSLSEEKQCNIQLTDFEGMSKHVCTIKGHLDNVLEVIAVLLKKELEVKSFGEQPALNPILLEVMRSHNAAINGENYAEKKMTEKRVANNCIHLTVPDAMAAVALGPKGKTLNEIKAYSGCRIKISAKDDDSVPEGMRIISIFGSDTEIELCKLMLQRIVNESCGRKKKP